MATLMGRAGTEASAVTAEATPAATRLRAAALRDRLEAPSIFRFFNHAKGEAAGTGGGQWGLRRGRERK